ncbi:MAG: PH domain-containing protein [Coxiellaceae bacterium]|jgi:uncharacterized membrane protein YdbT with pleckstrin-like domain|nr:PH domain-containing protein [Coxiellaceae bacterium]
MLYLKTTLLAEEQILYYTRPHYIVFFQVLVWFVLTLFAFKVIRSFLIGSVLLFMSLCGSINALISYYCSEYALTNKRILVKVGFIRRRSLEIFLDRVEGVYIEQSIIGRILNFGTVIIAGIGGTKSPFYYIHDPLKFRSRVQQQLPKSVGTIYN